MPDRGGRLLDLVGARAPRRDLLAPGQRDALLAIELELRERFADVVEGFGDLALGAGDEREEVAPTRTWLPCCGFPTLRRSSVGARDR
jgi:hypothetical protein